MIRPTNAIQALHSHIRMKVCQIWSGLLLVGVWQYVFSFHDQFVMQYFICLYRFALLIELWNMFLLLTIAGHWSSSSLNFGGIEWLFHLVEPYGPLNGVFVPYLCRDIHWKTDYWPLMAGEYLAHTLPRSSCHVCWFLGCQVTLRIFNILTGHC